MTNLEKLDTLQELQKALEQVTKERDWARDNVRHEQARASNALARAEQAERERDEAREGEDAARKHSRWVEEECARRIDESESARERAEADNAALLANEALAAEQEIRLRTLHRAEQAERERDEARRSLTFSDGVLKATEGQRNRATAESRTEKAARERAEADNAALSKHIDWTCHLLSLGQVERAVSYLRKAASHDHPGSALLEYVRALEAWREDVRKTVDGWGHAEDCPAAPEDDDAGPCECANGEMQALLEKVDALKGTP